MSSVARAIAGLTLCLLVGFTPMARAAGNPDALRLVDPFMGTGSGSAQSGGSGATFPGAAMPFGMVQFSPDTVPALTNVAGGYSYGDRQIRGFSLTHFSGAGCAIYQDVPILPTTAAVDTSPVTGEVRQVSPRYLAGFEHAHESASPGSYQVLLNPGSHAAINSELTATTRTGDARFTFPAQRRVSVLINAGGSSLADTATAVKLEPGRHEVVGSVETGGFCLQPARYRVYFVARFNRPFIAHGSWDGLTLDPGAETARASTPHPAGLTSDPGSALSSSPSGVQVGAYVSFDTRVSRTVEVDVGVSYTSVAEAQKNLDVEAGRRSFKALRSLGAGTWRAQLSKIAIDGGSREDRRLFYTSLYHALIDPSTLSDHDGRYPGMDGRIHRAGDSTQYTNISGWDVYRSQIPLLAILEPHVAEAVATSLLRDAQQSGCLPRWPYAEVQTNVMVGDPSDPMLAEIYAFGARAFDVRSALSRMVAGASRRCVSRNDDYTEREGLKEYLRLGYVPENLNTNVIVHTLGQRGRPWGAASTTLEDAVADSSIARLAGSLGRHGLAREFGRRAEDWSHLFDDRSGYIRPRFSSGAWLTPAGPTTTTGFVEGDSSQYTWMVPQDPAGLFRRMGGDRAAARRLDRFFLRLNAGPSAPYAFLGDEPTLGTPWLYDWLGMPAKATGVVHRALLGLYAPSPSGMPGNDDGGTMSAWWVLGALGLYPAVPGSDLLALSSPLFARATISLPAGQLVVTAKGVSNRRRYIENAQLDRELLERSWLNFASVSQGSHSLTLHMGTNDRSGWATAMRSRPPSLP